MMKGYAMHGLFIIHCHRVIFFRAISKQITWSTVYNPGGIKVLKSLPLSAVDTTVAIVMNWLCRELFGCCMGIGVVYLHA